MNSSKKIVTIGLVIVSAYYLYLCAPYFYGHFNYSRDFACFGYMAPNILRHASGSELYNLQTQRLFYPQQADLFMSYNHPPFEALIFIPLSFLPFAWAFIAWNLCNAAFLAVIGKKLSVLYGAAEKASILFFPRILWLLSAFFPVWFTLLNGQDSILFLLLLVLSLHSAYAQKFFQAGLLLGIAIFKPHLCLPLAAGMGARWKRPFLLGFILSAGFWTLLSVGLIGKNGVDQALSLLSLISKEHALFGIHYSQMANLRGALERVFPALGFDRMAAISMGAWLAGVAAIVYGNSRAAKSQNRRLFEFEDMKMCAITVLISYHANGPDLVLLLMPMLVLYKYGVEERKYNEVSWGVGFVAAALALFFFFTPIGMGSYSTFPNLIVFFELCIIFFPWRIGCQDSERGR